MGEDIGHAAQDFAVDLDASHLHFRQHGDQRAFKGFVDGRYAGAVQLRLEKLPQAQRHVGVFGGVFHRVVDGDLVKGDLAFSAAQQGLDRDRLMAEVKLGKRVHAVGVQARLHGIA